MKKGKPPPKAKPPVQGFDAVARRLTAIFQGVVTDRAKKKKPPPSTVQGAVSAASKQMKSNYQNSAQGRNRPSASTSSTPSDAFKITASRSSASSPVPPRLTRSATIAPTSATSSTSPLRPTKLELNGTYSFGDQSFRCMAPVTTLNCGMRRLNYYDIVRLRVADRITCVVPAANDSHINAANDIRRLVMTMFQSAILANRDQYAQTKRSATLQSNWPRELYNVRGRHFTSFIFRLKNIQNAVCLLATICQRRS